MSPLQRINLEWTPSKTTNMQDIFKQETIDTFSSRINNLNENTTAKWGKMNATQMLNHLNAVSSATFGEKNVKQPFIGKLIGRMILKKTIKDGVPTGKNKPTHPAFIGQDMNSFASEQEQILKYINKYPTCNPADFEGQKHPFFGKMTSNEWNKLIYKHLDHHLNQFGV